MGVGDDINDEICSEVLKSLRVVWDWVNVSLRLVWGWVASAWLPHDISRKLLSSPSLSSVGWSLIVKKIYEQIQIKKL